MKPTTAIFTELTQTRQRQQSPKGLLGQPAPPKCCTGKHGYTARQKLKFLELAHNGLIEKETTGKKIHWLQAQNLSSSIFPKKLSTVTNSYSHLYTSFPRELTVQIHLAQKMCECQLKNPPATKKNIFLSRSQNQKVIGRI